MDKRVRTAAWGIVCVAALVAGTAGSVPYASEAKAEFEVQARVVEIQPSSGGDAIARIEVFVEAFRSTHDVELTLEGPGGRTWLFKGRDVGIRDLEWNGSGGEPLEPGAEGIVVPAKGLIRTTIAVPIDRAFLREIVLRATGTVDRQPVVATAVVRIVLPGDPGAILDDGVHANFSLGEVK